MRKYLLASAALLMFTTPAVAKDGSWYAGIEGGALFPKDPNGGTIVATYTTVNAPVAPATTLPPNIPAGPASTTFTDPFNFDTNIGLDVDLIAGFDFGMFRVEGELGYKNSHLDSDVDSAFLTSVNTALNRPASATPLPADPVVPGLAPITREDFDLDRAFHVWSGMINGLLDFGGNDGLGGYVGGGVGYAGVHALGESDGKFAWQLIAGLYYPISDSIDIGLKGRYFDAGKVHNDRTLTFVGNANRIA